MLAVPGLPGVANGRPAAAPRDQRPLRIGEYQEAAGEIGYQWDRLEQSAGRPLERPDYLSIAKQRAGVQ